MKPKMVIVGANGYVGPVLARFFAPNYDIFTITRRPLLLPNTTNFLWDGETLGDWAAAIDGAEIVINMAGRSVNCRYTEQNRREILDSRVKTTRILGQAIAAAKAPPKVWLNSSTATIYRHAEDHPMTEADGEIGQGFSVDVAKAWEQTFFEADTPQTRKVALRTSIVLGKTGGVWPVLVKLARVGLSGTMGNGRQRFSWIHEEDFCRAIAFLIGSPPIDLTGIDLTGIDLVGLTLSGPVNLVAPQVPTNAKLMKMLRQKLGRAFGLPATRSMLSIGAIVLNTEPELVLKSRWVRAEHLLDAGFEFRFAKLETAMQDLLF